MKSMLKMLAAFLALSVALSNAFASTGYYGLPKQKPTAGNTLKSPQQFSNVVLRNFTNDDYMAYASYQPSGKLDNIYLGPYGSPYSVITYDIVYPDYQVCINLIRNFDGAPVYSGCESSGFIDIGGPYAAAAKNKNSKPQVKVTR